MHREIQAGNWRTFYVHLSGRTNGAHLPWVSRFKGIGQVQVNLPEDSDYILLFCPIASRVGTDISEALENIPADDKGFILVVMHHTFNRDHIVAVSRRHVNNPNLHLVVDTLFYEGEPLDSNLNENAWKDISRCLGVPAKDSTFSQYYRKLISAVNWVLKWKWPILGLFAGGFILNYMWKNQKHLIEPAPEEIVGKNK